MLDWLFDWLQDALQWFFDLVLWVPRKLYELVLDAFALVINAIPVPTWAEGLELDWIPSGMAYFLEPFQVGFGITVITASYLWRFLIRRIPVIG
jgi:hypothetical protein